MSQPRLDHEFSEPERYELREAPLYHFDLDRREFVQVLGAGLLFGMAAPSALAQRAGRDSALSLSQRLHIGKDKSLTVLTSKVEIGQGSRTQITQAAAEELHVPIDWIRLIMADSALVPDDGGTAGSRTTPSTIPAVRKACAAARQALVEAAATKFGVDPTRLSVIDGNVQGLGPDRHFDYSAFADLSPTAAWQQRISADVRVTAVKEWTVLGQATPKVGAAAIVTGAHQYPSDIVRPGMLYGKVLRPPSYGAELTEIDLAPARAIASVTAIQDGDFVGVAADSSFTAAAALAKAVETARWKLAPHPSSDELYEYLRKKASPEPGRRQVQGDPDSLLQAAGSTHRQSYHVAYIQHAPMEPRAAVAEWTDGKLTVWTGTQQPARVQDDLARAFKLGRDEVRVIVPDTGGGFGGKHTGEVAVEAARLAKAAKRPVSVRWSREDEFTWAYFRPAGVLDLAAALTEQGTITAWTHINFNSGASAIATPYHIPNTATEFKSCDQPLRSGSYRALAATANTFARESFMDELAAAAEVNPLAFRLQHLKNDRLRAVLVAVAEKFRWSSEWPKKPSGASTGVGLACGTEKGSYVACCVQVTVAGGRFRVGRITQAFECGAIQNPSNLQAQVTGCIIQGLGGALWEEMRFKDGKVLNPHFSQYHVPRFKDVPEIETVLLDRPDLASEGAGETPIIALAPAIANALFHATGERIRSLPIANERYRAAS